MNYEFFQLPHPFNPQLSPLKVRASERDVSLLTNRSASAAEAQQRSC